MTPNRAPESASGHHGSLENIVVGNPLSWPHYLERIAEWVHGLLFVET